MDEDWVGFFEDMGASLVRLAFVLAALVFCAGVCLGYLFGRFG